MADPTRFDGFEHVNPSTIEPYRVGIDTDREGLGAVRLATFHGTCKESGSAGAHDRGKVIDGHWAKWYICHKMRNSDKTIFHEQILPFGLLPSRCTRRFVQDSYNEVRNFEWRLKMEWLHYRWDGQYSALRKVAEQMIYGTEDSYTLEPLRRAVTAGLRGPHDGHSSRSRRVSGVVHHDTTTATKDSSNVPNALRSREPKRVRRLKRSRSSATVSKPAASPSISLTASHETLATQRHDPGLLKRRHIDLAQNDYDEEIPIKPTLEHAEEEISKRSPTTAQSLIPSTGNNAAAVTRSDGTNWTEKGADTRVANDDEIVFVRSVSSGSAAASAAVIIPSVEGLDEEEIHFRLEQIRLRREEMELERQLRQVKRARRTL